MSSTQERTDRLLNKVFGDKSTPTPEMTKPAVTKTGLFRHLDKQRRRLVNLRRGL